MKKAAKFIKEKNEPGGIKCGKIIKVNMERNSPSVFIEMTAKIYCHSLFCNHFKTVSY